MHEPRTRSYSVLSLQPARPSGIGGVHTSEIRIPIPSLVILAGVGPSERYCERAQSYRNSGPILSKRPFPINKQRSSLPLAPNARNRSSVESTKISGPDSGTKPGLPGNE